MHRVDDIGLKIANPLQKVAARQQHAQFGIKEEFGTGNSDNFGTRIFIGSARGAKEQDLVSQFAHPLQHEAKNRNNAIDLWQKRFGKERDPKGRLIGGRTKSG